MTLCGQRWAVDIRAPQNESTRIDIGRAVATEPLQSRLPMGMWLPGVAVMVTWRRSWHGGSVATQAIRHSLMSAGHRIQGIVARGRMTLSARSIGRMWFAGLAAVTSLAKVGVVVWQLPQSPETGCLASNAVEGRESPAVVELAIMPTKAAVW